MEFILETICPVCGHTIEFIVKEQPDGSIEIVCTNPKCGKLLELYIGKRADGEMVTRSSPRVVRSNYQKRIVVLESYEPAGPYNIGYRET